MTKADRIAAQYGCAILPTSGQHMALVLLPQNQGQANSSLQIPACRAALEQAGISTRGWVS